MTRRRNRISLRTTLRERPEIVIGRTAAVCAHPVAAWQVLSFAWKMVMLTAYAMAGYVGVLSALFASS